MNKLLAALLILIATVASAAPTVTLTASPTSGISPLNVTLSWSSTGAAVCSASGGWTGAKALSGSETVTGLKVDTTFSMLCSAADGSATLTWIPPTQNTDGSTIVATGRGALAGFKVYDGTSPGSLAFTADVVGGGMTTYTVNGLTAATWYFAVTAYNNVPVESDKTLPVSKVVSIPATTATANVTVNVKPNPPTNVTISVLAYEALPGGVRGRLVGNVPLGTQCSSTPYARTRQGTYYRIPSGSVTLTKRTRATKFVARCATA